MFAAKIRRTSRFRRWRNAAKGQFPQSEKRIKMFINKQLQAMRNAHGSFPTLAVERLRPSLILQCNNTETLSNERQRKEAYMTNSMIASSDAGFFGSIERGSSWGAGISRAWADYRTYRRTLGELRDLTDKQLDDLGLRRDALRNIAHRAVYGS